MGTGCGQSPILQGRRKKYLLLHLVASVCVLRVQAKTPTKSKRQHRCQAYNFSVGRSRKYVGMEKEEKKNKIRLFFVKGSFARICLRRSASWSCPSVPRCPRRDDGNCKSQKT